MTTPALKAAYVVGAIEGETVPEAWAELEVDPLADPRVVYFVSVKYHSPLRPFGAPRHQQHQEWLEAFDGVMKRLREGIDPVAAGKQLRRMQTWEWGAIALDPASLGEELKSRYELSDAEPETELGWQRIPGGIVITCEVLLRGVE